VSTVVIACDAFKGSLSAEQVTHALSAGFDLARRGITARVFPIGDGGEGTLEAFLRAGFTEMSTTAAGPTGELLATRFAHKGDIAFVELAEVCGILRLPGGHFAPLDASSYGFGQVIRTALDHGFRTVILGVGGSASTDGGAGMALALGAQIRDAAGQPIGGGGGELSRARQLDISNLHPGVVDAEFIIASDVQNPLLGPSGATAIYSAQKGATPRDQAELETGMGVWADLVEEKFDARGLRETLGAGAAGGVGFGALSFLGARVESGASLVLDLLKFDALLADCDLVVTGEGALDQQTLEGKAVHGVAAVARELHVPVVAVCGVNSLSSSELGQLGVADVFSLSDREPNVERSKANAYGLLVEVGQYIAEKFFPNNASLGRSKNRHEKRRVPDPSIRNSPL